MKISPYRNKIAIVLAVLAILLITGFLGYRYVAPFGKTVSYQFSSKLPGAKDVTNLPSGQGGSLKIPSQIIATEQSRFSVDLLSPNVESIKATLKFKKGPPEIKLGIRGNEKDNLSYSPLYNSILENLIWEKTEKDNFALWQREKKYQSVDNFVRNPPDSGQIASYFFDKDALSLPISTSTDGRNVVVKARLRCSHEALIKVDSQPLVVKVTKQDMNTAEGEDKFRIKLLKGEKILSEKEIKDDGITDSSKLKTDPQTEIINLEKLDPGIYRLSMEYLGKGCDSVITGIEVNQDKIIFEHTVAIEGDAPTVLWTDSPQVNIAAGHAEGVQIVKLNDKENLRIDSQNKKFNFDLQSLSGKNETGKLYKLESPKNDLVLETQGYFSFSENSFFKPGVFTFADINIVDEFDKKINYILTTYKKTKHDGDWLVAEIDIDPKDVNINSNKLFFSLDIPGLTKSNGELEIDSLKIEVRNKGALETKTEESTTNKNTPTPSNTRNKNFFSFPNLSFPDFGQIYKKTSEKIVKLFSNLSLPNSKSSNKISLAPTKQPTLSPVKIITPTPTPASLNFDSIKVSVLNGSTEKGIATKFAELLKTAGFKNIKSENADKSDYKGALVRFRSADKDYVSKISKLLETDYKTIDRKEIATTSAEIVVILGAK